MLRSLITAVITSLLFFPDNMVYENPDQFGNQWEDVVVKTSDDVDISAWYLKADDAKGVMLYLHGNAGNITGRVSKVQGWLQRGISVLLLDYRGYGKSKGQIKHEKDLVTDAEAGYLWLRTEKQWEPTQIIVYGESLGSNPAIQLGIHHDLAAVVLEAPYTAFTDLAPLHYGMIPKWMAEKLLKNFSFANKDIIEKLNKPLFILHGTEDQTCPYFMGQKLFDLANQPKEFYSIQNGQHNDLPDTGGEDYWDKPFQFVRKYLRS